MKRCVQCDSKWLNTTWDCPKCGFEPAKIDGVMRFAPEIDAGSGFDDAFFPTLAKLEDKNFWFQNRNALVIWAIEQFQSVDSSFLEVGCGTGHVLKGIREKFPAMQLSGSEISTIGIGMAKSNGHADNYYQLDACSMPFYTEYDGIGMFDVLEHIKDDKLAVMQAFAATKPGGCLFVTVPQHMWLWSTIDSESHHVRRYSRQVLVELIRDSGYEIVFSTSFVSLLLPIITFRRLVLVKNKKNHSIFEELMVGDVANWVGSLLMKMERIAIKWGIRLPFGSSLLVVARRQIG